MRHLITQGLSDNASNQEKKAALKELYNEMAQASGVQDGMYISRDEIENQGVTYISERYLSGDDEGFFQKIGDTLAALKTTENMNKLEEVAYNALYRAYKEHCPEKALRTEDALELVVQKVIELAQDFAEGIPSINFTDGDLFIKRALSKKGFLLDKKMEPAEKLKQFFGGIKANIKHFEKSPTFLEKLYTFVTWLCEEGYKSTFSEIKETFKLVLNPAEARQSSIDFKEQLDKIKKDHGSDLDQDVTSEDTPSM